MRLDAWIFRASLGTVLCAACASTETAAVAPLQVLSPNTASVTGIVRFDGDPPVPRRIELGADDRARTGVDAVPDETWVVAKDGAVANSVVTLHALKDTPKPAPRALEGAGITQVGARFEPHVLVVPQGSTVAFRGGDSDCACYHTYAKKNPALNAKIAKGEARELVLEHDEVIPVLHDLLPWMKAYVVVVDTPLFAVTGGDGAFRFDGLAPGRYRLELWHEQGRRAKRVLELAAGDAERIELPLAAPRAR